MILDIKKAKERKRERKELNKKVMLEHEDSKSHAYMKQSIILAGFLIIYDTLFKCLCPNFQNVLPRNLSFLLFNFY